MIILGLDPGSLQAGYAVIELSGRKFNYLHSGALLYKGQGSFLERLPYIYSSCEKLVADYHPAEIALESLIYVKNPTSLMKLAQARGVMLAAFAKTHAEKIFEYSPNLVKSSSTGFGHADKEGIQKSMRMIFGIKSFQTFDESDALAVALCHALNRGNSKNDRTHSGNRTV
ncbi:MAG: crossover junction endodeoxyribonuclease RuvC [Pseudomonadota bacterium]